MYPNHALVGFVLVLLPRQLHNVLVISLPSLLADT